MKKILFLFLTFIPLLLSAQSDTLNKIDSQGKKQGYWKKHEKGKLIYEGRFVDDVPTGIFTYYYTNGKVKSKSNFLNGVHKVETILFNENGKKASEGIFIDQLKEGEWRYYGDQEILVKIEGYKKGKKEGAWKTFSNQTGAILKEEYYKNDKLDGLKINYFTTGDTNTITPYVNGHINGKFICYYPEHKLSYSGFYHQNKRIDEWNYYSIAGKIRKTINFKEDVSENVYIYFYNGSIPQKLNQSLIAYIRKINDDKTEVTLFDNKKIVYNDSYESIFDWLDILNFNPISATFSASYDALKGYTVIDEKTVLVKLLPKPAFDVTAQDDYAKMIISLFDTSVPQE